VVSRSYDIWGSELSPFVLKVRALCRYASIETRLLPNEGSYLENLEAVLRVERIKRGRLELTYPRMTPLDEFPLTPFLLGSGGENLYDSTAIADWIDAHFIQPGAKLIPEDPVLEFAARLIDEYFDEFGLYLVHHNRWVTAAHGNDAGDRLAQEYRGLVWRPLRQRFSRWFSARQTRRLGSPISSASPTPRFRSRGSRANGNRLVETDSLRLTTCSTTRFDDCSRRSKQFWAIARIC
jgi:glutathione S-transferase